MQHEAQPTKHLVQMRCCVTSERYIHFSPLLKWFVHKCLSRLQKCAQKNAQIMNTHDFIQISKKKKKNSKNMALPCPILQRSITLWSLQCSMPTVPRDWPSVLQCGMPTVPHKTAKHCSDQHQKQYHPPQKLLVYCTQASDFVVLRPKLRKTEKELFPSGY